MKWTYNACYEEAKKYETRGEFYKKNKNAYNAAWEKGWLDEWFSKARHNSGYWTKERCKEEAKKYKTRTEFQKENGSAYNVAFKNGWLDEYTWFIRKGNTFENKIDNVYAYFFGDKSVYVGRTIEPDKRDIKHNTDTRGSVYRYAHKICEPIPDMTILESGLTLNEGLEKEDYYVRKYREEGWNVINKGKTGVKSGSIGSIGQGHLNYKHCCEVSKKYKTRNEFRKGDNSAYQTSCRKGWIDSFTWLESPKTSLKWTYESCREESKKYKTRNEFNVKSNSAYQISCRNGWLDEFTWLEDGRKMSGIRRTKWTYEACFEEAKKYKTRTEFQKENGSAYNVAFKNGWLDEYTWFIETKHHNNYWTPDLIWENVYNYNDYVKFKTMSNNVYQAAYRKGMLPKIKAYYDNKKRA